MFFSAGAVSFFVSSLTVDCYSRTGACGGAAVTEANSKLSAVSEVLLLTAAGVLLEPVSFSATKAMAILLSAF